MSQLKDENRQLKDKIEEMNLKFTKQKAYADNCVDDRNNMQYRVEEKNVDMMQVLNKLKNESEKNKDLVTQIKS